MNPRRRFLPWTIVALLWVGFAVYVWSTTPQLPERVATHFNAAGTPNGWMTRDQHVRFTLLFGGIVPAFIFGIFSLMSLRYGQALNLPNKDYWLAPERREGAVNFIQRQGAWFAGMFVLFIGGIHASVIAANAQRPVNLSPSSVAWVSGPFLAATAVWLVIFIGRFFRRPA